MACGNCNTCDVSEKRGCGTSSVFDWLYQIESVDKNNRKQIRIIFLYITKPFDYKLYLDYFFKKMK